MSKNHRTYLLTVIGAAAGWAASLIVPGMEPGVGLAAGVAVGLSIGTESADERHRCQLPWTRHRRSQGH